MHHLYFILTLVISSDVASQHLPESCDDDFRNRKENACFTATLSNYRSLFCDQQCDDLQIFFELLDANPLEEKMRYTVRFDPSVGSKVNRFHVGNHQMTVST